TPSFPMVRLDDASSDASPRQARHLRRQAPAPMRFDPRCRSSFLCACFPRPREESYARFDLKEKRFYDGGTQTRSLISTSVSPCLRGEIRLRRTQQLSYPARTEPSASGCGTVRPAALKIGSAGVGARFRAGRTAEQARQTVGRRSATAEAGLGLRHDPLRT